MFNPNELLVYTLSYVIDVYAFVAGCGGGSVLVAILTKAVCFFFKEMLTDKNHFFFNDINDLFTVLLQLTLRFLASFIWVYSFRVRTYCVYLIKICMVTTTYKLKGL